MPYLSSLPSRTTLRPASSEENSEHYSNGDGQAIANNVVSSNSLARRPSQRHRAFVLSVFGDVFNEDKRARAKQDSSTGSTAPLVQSIENKQPSASGNLSHGASDRLRVPFRSSSKKTVKKFQSTETLAINALDSAYGIPALGENVDPQANAVDTTSDHPFEKLEKPFHLRPFSALDKRDPPKEKPSPLPVLVGSSIPVAIDSPRPLRGDYRSTSSSYPSEGIRTPELANSPVNSVRRNRIFSSLGWYGRAMFSSGSRSSTKPDETKGVGAEDCDIKPGETEAGATKRDETNARDTKTNEIKVDETKVDGREASEIDTKMAEIDTNESVNRPLEVGNDAGLKVERRGVDKPKVENEKHLDPRLLDMKMESLANTSTETIVKSSSEIEPRLTLLVEPFLEPPPCPGESARPEISDDTGVLPLTEVNVEAFARIASSPSTAAASSSSGPADANTKQKNPKLLPIVLDGKESGPDTTTDEKEVKSSAASDEPALRVRLGRRVRAIKFSRWISRRFRRGKYPLEKGVSKKLSRAAQKGKGEERAQKAGKEKRKKADIVRLKNTDVPGMSIPDKKKKKLRSKLGIDSDGQKHSALMTPAGTDGPESDTLGKKIGKKAAGWLKERKGSVKGSVQLSRYLLNEMRWELKHGL